MRARVSVLQTPTAKDPNYLKSYVMAVELPENAAFAPQLEIRVYDRKMGLTHPLIGATSVRLDTKLPWNMEDYVAPLTMEFKKGREIVDDQEEDEATDPTERDEDDEGDDEEEGEGGDKPPTAGGEGEEEEGEKRDPRALEDPGTGVFPLDQDVELGLVQEDIEHEEKARRRAEERRKAGKGGGQVGGMNEAMGQAG